MAHHEGGGGQTRSYTYDGLSRLTSTTQPESGTTQFFYTTSTGALCSGDPNAVCRRTDARNITTTYTYDALNRLTSKTYSDTTPAANFFYDEPSVLVGTNYALTNTKGRLSHTAVGTSAITIHSYDPAGRVADLWQCTPFNCSSPSIWNMHYTYDLAGDVTSWTHPAAFRITNTITTAQRVSQIASTLNDGTHPPTLATLSYAPQGAISTLVSGCAGTGCVQLQESYDYNNRLQPSRIQLGTSAAPSANACLVYNYYSSVGNPTTCAPPTQGTGNNGNVIGYLYQTATPATPALGHTGTYSYDALNRLATSVATGSSTHNLTFSYDRFGNMTCVTNAQTQGPCPGWSFSALTNRITNANFIYDAAGNLTQDGTGVGTHTYQYDAESRMITVDTGTTAAYTYNALGQRVEKKLGTAYTEFLYSASGEPVGEHNRTIWTLSVVPLGGRHLAHYNYQDGKTYFVHGNSLGSTSQVSDQTGAVAQDQLLYPFGQDWRIWSSGTLQEKRFAELGHWDPETDLYPTPNRMFASGKGRWMIPDPLAGDITNPQSLNRYAYVLNNPINSVDPLGLNEANPDSGFCFALSGNCGGLGWSGPGSITRFGPEGPVTIPVPGGIPGISGGGSGSGSHGGGGGGTGTGTSTTPGTGTTDNPAPETLAPPPAPAPRPTSPAPPPPPFGEDFFKSARLPGEGFFPCVDRTQKALLGNIGGEVLGGVTGVGLVTSVFTRSVGRGLTTVAGTGGKSVVRTKVGTSLADLAIKGGLRAGTISAETSETLSAASAAASKVAVPILGAALTLQGGFFAACR